LDNDIWNTLTVERNLIQNGHIDVPEKPGLGVTVDEDVARRVAQQDLGYF
jgi:L-alanine-DL-glutamate epimerase-like enolase superfamily enzyme